MKMNDKFILMLLGALLIFSSCSNEDENEFYSNWTTTNNGLSSSTTKNVLTEFVGSTNCPYCPEDDAKLLSYFDTDSDQYVGSEIADNWYLINYHTYSPTRGDPMYEFHRGTSETGEDDYCYIRFEEGSWYTLYGVPTTYTNGASSSVNPEMALGSLSDRTPLSISLNGTSIDGPNINVKISIRSSRDLSLSDSLHLFIAATMDDVNYTGYNGEPEHQDVFLGWITEGLIGETISIQKEEISKNYIGDVKLLLSSKKFYQYNGGGICVFAWFSKLPYFHCWKSKRYVTNEMFWKKYSQFTSWQFKDQKTDFCKDIDEFIDRI